MTQKQAGTDPWTVIERLVGLLEAEIEVRRQTELERDDAIRRMGEYKGYWADTVKQRYEAQDKVAALRREIRELKKGGE